MYGSTSLRIIVMAIGVIAGDECAAVILIRVIIIMKSFGVMPKIIIVRYLGILYRHAVEQTPRIIHHISAALLLRALPHHLQHSS